MRARTRAHISYTYSAQRNLIFLSISVSSHEIQPPVYINVVREPIDRLASHYYYNKYGSNSAPKGQATSNLVSQPAPQTFKILPAWALYGHAL